MIGLIVAKSKNNVIGINNGMPWSQRNDLQRFKALTYGSTIIMGRNTYESIGKPLPGRQNIVLTRDVDAFYEKHHQKAGELTLCTDLQTAAQPFFKYEFPNRMHCETCWITGGQSVFEEGIAIADKLFITEIDVTVDPIGCNVAYFSTIDTAIWKMIASESYKADEFNQYDYKFDTYVRREPKELTMFSAS